MLQAGAKLDGVNGQAFRGYLDAVVGVLLAWQHLIGGHGGRGGLGFDATGLMTRAGLQCGMEEMSVRCPPEAWPQQRQSHAIATAVTAWIVCAGYCLSL